MSLSGHSGLPSAATATDFVGLRRVVCTLQAEVEQQRARQGSLAEHRDVAAIGRARGDYTSLRRQVTSIQEELKDLKVKTRILNTRTAQTRGKTEALEVRLDDLEHEGDEGDEGDDVDADASDNAGSAAGADLSISVAAVRRSLEDGDWVAISGHLWKEKPDSSSAPALVSRNEVKDVLGGPWAAFSCYTDAELKEMGVVRAGKDRTIATPITEATLKAAESDYVKATCLAFVAAKIQRIPDY